MMHVLRAVLLNIGFELLITLVKNVTPAAMVVMTDQEQDATLAQVDSFSVLLPQAVVYHVMAAKLVLLKQQIVFHAIPELIF